MTGLVMRDALGRPVRVLGYVRDPAHGEEVRFVEVLDKKYKSAADFVHTIVIRKGIECDPIQTYIRVKDF